jgi:hypothetical protein
MKSNRHNTNILDDILAQQTNDTILLADSEACEFALAIYNSARDAAPGTSPVRKSPSRT